MNPYFSSIHERLNSHKVINLSPVAVVGNKVDAALGVLDALDTDRFDLGSDIGWGAEASKTDEILRGAQTWSFSSPDSLDVLRNEVLHWNATCWLDRFPIPRLAVSGCCNGQPADHCNTLILHEGQICEFKGSQLNNDRIFEIPEIRLLIVFPHMKRSFDSEEVQRIWTDDIVLPSIYRHVDSNVRQHLPTSYRILRLNSEVNKSGPRDSIGDTPLCVSFRSDSLEGIWAGIVSKTREKEFEEFSGTFLVALGQWHATATIKKSVEGAWKTLIDSWWGLEMDMNYIPIETFQVRMENEFRLERRVESEAACVVAEGDASLMDDDAGADSGDDSESVSSAEE